MSSEGQVGSFFENQRFVEEMTEGELQPYSPELGLADDASTMDLYALAQFALDRRSSSIEGSIDNLQNTKTALDFSKALVTKTVFQKLSKLWVEGQNLNTDIAYHLKPNMTWAEVVALNDKIPGETVELIWNEERTVVIDVKIPSVVWQAPEAPVPSNGGSSSPTPNMVIGQEKGIPTVPNNPPWKAPADDQSSGEALIKQGSRLPIARRLLQRTLPRRAWEKTLFTTLKTCSQTSEGNKLKLKLNCTKMQSETRG